MKILISQQSKKLVIEFSDGDDIDTYEVDRAEDFLAIVDKFIKKRHTGLEIIQGADLEFADTGLLTERIIRSIILGLNFHSE